MWYSVRVTLHSLTAADPRLPHHRHHQCDAACEQMADLTLIRSLAATATTKSLESLTYGPPPEILAARPAGLGPAPVVCDNEDNDADATTRYLRQVLAMRMLRLLVDAYDAILDPTPPVDDGTPTTTVPHAGAPPGQCDRTPRAQRRALVCRCASRKGAGHHGPLLHGARAVLI